MLYRKTSKDFKGTSKIPIFKLFNVLEKTWKCSLGFSKILILNIFYELGKTWKYTDQDQHFKIQNLNLWMKWESFCPNLSFTVESEIGNFHKKGWLHFEPDIND